MSDDLRRLIDDLRPEEKILALEYFAGGDPDGFREAAREARMRYERADGYQDDVRDLRQRYAEAIAAKFTHPVYRCDRDGENERVENPEPADRIDQTPYVMVTAGDGCRSFWTPSCAELGEVVAAVRDEELERLKERAEKAERQVTASEYGIAHLEKRIALLERRAANAEERLSLARDALLDDGYFKLDEVGADVAPRITERLSALRHELEQWHAAYGETALPGTLARLRAAESAVARARSLAKGWANGSGLTTTLAARALLAALDGRETGRG